MKKLLKLLIFTSLFSTFSFALSRDLFATEPNVETSIQYVKLKDLFNAYLTINGFNEEFYESICNEPECALRKQSFFFGLIPALLTFFPQDEVKNFYLQFFDSLKEKHYASESLTVNDVFHPLFKKD